MKYLTLIAFMLLVVAIARAEWELLPTTQVLTSVNAIETDGRRLFAGTSHGLYISDDNGETWCTTALRPGDVKSIAISGDTIYAFMYKAGLEHGMYRSDDRGETWNRKNNGFPHINVSTGLIPSIHQILVTRSGAVIAVGDVHGTYISRDRGETWHVPADWAYPCVKAIDRKITHHLHSMTEYDGFWWAATSGGQLYRSADNGAAWECLGVDRLRSVGDANDWAVLDNQLYVAASQGVHGFARWDEAKLAVEHLSHGLPHTPNVTSLAVNHGRIFAGIDALGVYMFDERSETWTNVGLGLGLLIRSLVSHQSHLYAAIDNTGIYRASIPIVNPYGRAATTWGAIKTE